MKTLATIKTRNANGRALRVCSLETPGYTVKAIESNLTTLARLQAEARRRGHAKTTAWLGERLAFWSQFLRPQFAAQTIANAIN